MPTVTVVKRRMSCPLADLAVGDGFVLHNTTLMRIKGFPSETADALGVLNLATAEVYVLRKEMLVKPCTLEVFANVRED